MRRIKFHAAARTELGEAVDYYESQGNGLGAKLLEEVSAVTDRIARYPLAAPKVGQDARRVPVKAFSYQIVYKITGDLVVVVAVMHKRRRPGYWKGRL